MDESFPNPEDCHLPETKKQEKNLSSTCGTAAYANMSQILEVGALK